MISKSASVLSLENFSESDKERFWSYVEKLGNESGCWLWIGGMTDAGYGAFWFKGTTQAAHRVAYLLVNGDIDHSLDGCHRCDTPCCVNPEHIFLGTEADNYRDSKSKGRNVRGEKHGMSKLTEEDVRSIRFLRDSGIRNSKIAKIFNVTQALIGYIVKRKIWAHIK